MDAGDRPDADYTPAGHLDGGGPVYEGDRPALRARVLLLGLGHLLRNGL